MLSPELKNKIDSLDVREPYVWRLRLSNQDFASLEDSIIESISKNGGGHSHLLTKENALAVLVYIAEWYKRKYDVSDKRVEFNSDELAALWNFSGINIDKYVYKRVDGSRLWQYSTYILGGLAIGHELGKPDNARFFKTLCRIYNGEDTSIESLSDTPRAIAFKESIRQRHSLYYYLQAILNGDLPFSTEDLSGPSNISLFLELVKRANEEVLRSKFRLEWLITFSPGYDNMSRRLRIWLNPEQVGEGLNQYLRYDRLAYWGIPSPTTILHLKIYVRFMKDGNPVGGEEQCVITYSNTGDYETGFVSWNVENSAICKHIPSSDFDVIEMVLRTGLGDEYVVQRQEVPDYLQVWRENPYQDSWTNRKDSQKSTAVVFKDTWHARLDSTSEEVYRKHFYDAQTGKSQPFNWVYIPDRITLEDELGIQKTFFNAVGYDHLTTRQHWDVIHYRSGGCILHEFVDDELEETVSEEIPVIFSADDVIVRHFENAFDEQDSPLEPEDLGPLEYRGVNGRYSPWDAESKPDYGTIVLRRSIRGRHYTLKCAYLPRQNAEQPIVRGFDTCTIQYVTFDSFRDTRTIILKDAIPLDGIPLIPAIPVRIGPEADCFVVDVYRPTLIKEVCLDGAFEQYLFPGEEIRLPYILKDRVCINDFSRDGFRRYRCSNLCTIFSDRFLNIKENYNAGQAALAYWHRGQSVPARNLDESAPEYLSVEFGSKPGQVPDSNPKWYKWDYFFDTVPEPVLSKDVHEPRNLGIVFQSLAGCRSLAYCYPLYNDGDPWDDDYDRTSALSSFEVASEHGIYFFMMQPLREKEAKDMKKEVYEPLMEKRGGRLTETDCRNLLRLAEEFAFSWEAYGIEINK